MINIEDKNYQPNLEEIREYIGNTLFTELCDYMEENYKALRSIEYSGDKVLLGWNVKFKKAGKTLCTIYPRRGYFPLLLIIGPKEKQRAEALLPDLCEEFLAVYNNSWEGMGQRWMVFELHDHGALYEDILKIVRLRREKPAK